MSVLNVLFLVWEKKNPILIYVVTVNTEKNLRKSKTPFPLVSTRINSPQFSGFSIRPLYLVLGTKIVPTTLGGSDCNGKPVDPSRV